MNPVWHHASQLALFIVAAWLAAAVASRLIGDPVAGFAAGLVVLIHPANVEAAVYLRRGPRSGGALHPARGLRLDPAS
jgi:hypothetical protein